MVLNIAAKALSFPHFRHTSTERFKSQFIVHFGDIENNDKNWPSYRLVNKAEIASSKRIFAKEYQALSFQTMAASNPDTKFAFGRKCSEYPQLRAKNVRRTTIYKKITVVEIVSTTVTDLVAETGFEPATSGL